MWGKLVNSMTTLRRSLRAKFEEVLSSKITYWQERGDDETLGDIADILADATLEMIRKPSFDLKASDPAWALLSGQEVTQEQLDRETLAKEATDSFERDLHFNPLPWSSTKSWEKLEKFVVQEYKKDKQVFFKYDSWRKGKGKYVGALNNKNITQTPESFISCFPDFLAHTEMYPEKKPVQTSFVEEDDNGIPISR